jgi:hypothetical protein
MISYYKVRKSYILVHPHHTYVMRCVVWDAGQMAEFAQSPRSDLIVINYFVI